MAAGLTAIYALMFFIICVLFKKEPVKGFGFRRKKKKKKKNTASKPKKEKIEASGEGPKEEPSPVKNEFGEEAAAYFSAGGAFVRHAEEAEEKEQTADTQSEAVPADMDITEPDIEETPEQKANSLEDTVEIAPVQESEPVAMEDEKEPASEENEETEFSSEIASDADVLTDLAELETLEEEEAKEIEFAPQPEHKDLKFIRAIDRENEQE